MTEPEPEPSPLERWEAEVAELADRMAQGRCLRCGGAGLVSIPEVRRGSLVLRPGRRIPCPDCGGVPRIVQVVEHDRDAWVQGMAVAGDLGAGWSGPEWERIRAGEPNPDGRRITGAPE